MISMHNKSQVALLVTLMLLSCKVDSACKSESEIFSSSPSSHFTNHLNGTVTDNKTNLMWSKCVIGQDTVNCNGMANSYTWDLALQTAENSTLAGYNDWRLPNIKELRSIVEQRCSNPAINEEVFPNTPGSHFWSSSSSVYNSSHSWIVTFYSGESYSYLRNQPRFVRLVRTAPL